MMRYASWTVAIPLLLGTTPYNTALAASASGTCADGHKISASTGTNGGGCGSVSVGGKTQSINCQDANGNSAKVNCEGSVVTTGSGNGSARKILGGGGGPGPTLGGTAPINPAANKGLTGGAVLQKPLGGSTGTTVPLKPVGTQK